VDPLGQIVNTTKTQKEEILYHQRENMYEKEK